MKFGRIGIIFSILFLVSVLGMAADTVEKNNKKPVSTSSGVRSSAASNVTTTGVPTSSATTTAVTTSLVEDANSLQNERSETTNTVEETPSVKGVKKRGVPENPASLFEDEKGFLAGLDYPELQVVPRASERLQMESQEERSSFISSYWPVQVSSIALIMAGSMSSGKFKQEDPTDSQKKENQFASQMGTIVGLMWLGGTYYLNHSLSYSKAIPDIKKVTGKDKKSLLMKERLSEEALERPAKIASMINNFSVWTNFLLALYINEHSKQGMPSYTGLAIGLSFLPMLIDNRIVENWEKHLEYKRKIYAPITRVDFVVDPNSRQLTPLLGMQWRF